LEYKYEFKNKCYKNCPNDISESSEENKFKCELKCPKEFPFEIKMNKTCVNFCSISEMSQKLCKINYGNKIENLNTEVEEKVIENIKKEIKFI
jgi:hypothetical protein